MLWRAMLRDTAKQLLKNAAVASGANVVSSKDTPIPADTLPWFIVYADDKKQGGNYGSEPRFKTHGTVTIEIRAEGDSQEEAEATLDVLCELAENALLGGQGFSASCACVLNSFVVTPDPALFAQIGPGMTVEGDGLTADQFVAVASVDAVAKTVTLTQPFLDPDGAVLLRFGNFVGLFEQIDAAETETDFSGKENEAHIAGATLTITGHTTEFFANVPPQPLTGMNIYVDSVNIFDPQGDYDTPPLEPFAVQPAPRTAGPDGRPEIVGSVDLPQT